MLRRGARHPCLARDLRAQSVLGLGALRASALDVLLELVLVLVLVLDS